MDALKNFFLEGESELIALELQNPAQGGVSTEEDGHLAHLLLPDLGEHFVPVGSAGVGSGLQAGDQVSLFLKHVRRGRRVNNDKTHFPSPR